MNRIDRLTAILIQLQSRRTIKAQEIADRFAISLRTVYRDVRSLEEAGIPIIGEAGVGYSLTEGYRLPPVMFTREEATAFITAEKLVAGLTDAEHLATYSNALYKVKAVLRLAEKDYIDTIDDRIQVLKVKRPVTDQITINPLQTILTALAEKKVVQLDYFSYYRQEQTQRKVEPIGVFYLDNYWHLIAHCQERKSCRDFRFDRITGISLTDEIFVDLHQSLKDYINNQYKDQHLEEVSLIIDPEAVLHLGEQKYYNGYVSEEETAAGLQMNFLTMSIEGFARWYMCIADYAQIVQSDKLRERVKSLYKAIGERLQSK